MVGAIATSIGVIGFVAVVGGAIMWIRFDSVGLPADKAVAAVPRAELLVVGLYTLIPFIALGLGFTLLAYLYAAGTVVPTAAKIDLESRWAGSPSGVAPDAGPLPDALQGVIPTGLDQERLSKAAQEAINAAHAAARAGAAAEAAADFGSPRLAKTHSKEAVAAAALARQRAEEGKGSLTDAKIDYSRLVESADASQVGSENAVKRASKGAKGQRVRVALSAGVLVAFEIGLVLIAAPRFLLVLALIGVAILLAGAALTVGYRTPGFALFGASIFITILLFGTVRALTRTLDQPKVQSAAVLRSGPDLGLMGYYIAETSDQVYLGRVEGQTQLAHRGSKVATVSGRKLARIVTVPRSSVVAMEIGPLRSRSVALADSKDLLQELCAEKVAEATAQASSSTTQSKKASSGQGQKSTVTSPCPPSNASSTAASTQGRNATK